MRDGFTKDQWQNMSRERRSEIVKKAHVLAKGRDRGARGGGGRGRGRRRRGRRASTPPGGRGRRARRGSAPPAPAHARTLGRQPPVVAEPAPRRGCAAREDGHRTTTTARRRARRRTKNRRSAGANHRHGPKSRRATSGSWTRSRGTGTTRGGGTRPSSRASSPTGPSTSSMWTATRRRACLPLACGLCPSAAPPTKVGAAARLPKRRLPRRPRARRSRRPSRVLHGNRATTTTNWTTRLLMHPCRGAGCEPCSRRRRRRRLPIGTPSLMMPTRPPQATAGPSRSRASTAPCRGAYDRRRAVFGNRAAAAARGLRRRPRRAHARGPPPARALGVLPRGRGERRQ